MDDMGVKMLLLIYSCVNVTFVMINFFLLSFRISSYLLLQIYSMRMLSVYVTLSCKSRDCCVVESSSCYEDV